MAAVFLDANILIDWIQGREPIDTESLSLHTLYISPLSVHILAYIAKCSIPSEKLEGIQDVFSIVALDENVLGRALVGPTHDLEDNIQLQSAALADCDMFITGDASLLKMGFFGKVAISPVAALG